MKTIFYTLLIISVSFSAVNCSSQKQHVFKPIQVYKSKNLIVTQIAENSFLHTSFKQTNDFGNVPCNGLFVRNRSDIIVFDTPTSDLSADELIWIVDTLKCEINAVIPTHFHDDCVGGLKVFHNYHIPSYAYVRTIQFSKENNSVVPMHIFKDSLLLKVGDEVVQASFFGEGHTKDNIVCYFPSDTLLFGGCLVKAKGASKGYVDDAKVNEWSNTVQKVKLKYSNAKNIVPGHGDFGSKKNCLIIRLKYLRFNNSFSQKETNDVNCF